MFCLYCGNAMEEGDLFCENCGNKNDAPRYIACTICGQLSEATAVFCEFCGNKVGQADEDLRQPAGTSIGNPYPQQTAATTTPVYPQTPTATAVVPAYKQARTADHRMLLIFLLDISASAASYTKQFLTDLSKFVIDINSDNIARSALDMAVIQFSDSFCEVENLADAINTSMAAQSTWVQAGYSAPIKAALRMTEEHSREYAQSYKPWVIMVTSGEPSDDITAIVSEVQSLQRADKLRFMALGVLDYNTAVLKSLTDVVFRQKGTDFTSFFEWLSKCLGVIVRTAPREKAQLPNLEGDIYRDR